MLELEFRKNPKQDKRKNTESIGTDLCYYVPKIRRIIFNCAKYVQEKVIAKDRKAKLDNMFRQLSVDLRSSCKEIKQNAVVIVLSEDNQIAKLYVEYIKKEKDKGSQTNNYQRCTDNRKTRRKRQNLKQFSHWSNGRAHRHDSYVPYD